MNKQQKPNLSGAALTALVILRIAVGWHFLYEGLAKLFNPHWTSASYLDLSRWIFSDLFRGIANDPTWLKIIDFLNIWGLILIGLGLILGCFTRPAAIAGMVLLFLYYIANPPFPGLGLQLPMEGRYLLIDKNLIELFALLVLALVPTGRFFGLDRFWLFLKNRPQKLKEKEISPETSDPHFVFERRDLLRGLATFPFLGAFAAAVLKRHGTRSHEEKNLVDAVTSATIKTFNFSGLKDLKGQVPHASIGNKKFSRVILGGNLVGGWAHARDLIYTSKLVKAYHHDEKVFETFLLAEKCGINVFLTNPVLCRVINKYWGRKIGNIKFISDCGGNNLLDMAQLSIDNGADACYVHGGVADMLVQNQQFDLIGKALDLIRRNGLPAGIGGHYLDTIKGCVDQGIIPDFWMKTLHHLNYWSAKPEEECDNVFCRKPDETIAYMQNLKQPWIAFKILGAGAIHPKEGFRYAFENGADFICVGMYDFQIVDDANIALDVLKNSLDRKRPWMA